MADKILELIKKDIKQKKCRYEARKYYNYKPRPYKSKEEYYYKNGQEYPVIQKEGEIYINYFKMLVTQKIDYILSKKPSYDERIDESGINVYTMLDKLLFNASLDARTWLHLYLADNQLNYIVIKDSEVIPFYSDDKKKLIKLIRYYQIDDILHVEIWVDSGVKRIQYKKDLVVNETIESHYTTDIYTGNELDKSIESNFPMIPFIPLWNNKDETSDMYDIENIIIAYNAICTGFVDNIDKFQEALLILRGYIGDNESIKQVMKDIKEAKGVSVDKDGDAGYMTVDIPVEARQAILDILRDSIFLIGRGVDPSKLAEGTNITNVVLKSRYIQLDFKASDCIKRIIDFYEQFVNFINLVKRLNAKKDLELNKSMLINEEEMIDNCLKSQNMVSRETNLKHHPFVEDVKKEIKLLDIEETERQKMFESSINDNNFNNNQNNKNNPKDKNNPKNNKNKQNNNV